MNITRRVDYRKYKQTARPAFVAGIVMLFLLLAGVASAEPTPSAALERMRVIPVATSGNGRLDDYVLRLLSERTDRVRFRKLSEEANDPALLQDAPFVLAIGPSAFSRIRQADRSAPVLALLVEQSFIESYILQAPERIGAVYFDVPLLRQAFTGKAILPQAKRIALLASPQSAELYETLLDQLPEQGLSARLFIAESPEQLIPTLNRALSYGDFLLAGPDETIYNPRNIKHILLTAYRRNKILIGPSQSYVKAGALASSYIAFDVMADQAIEHITSFIDTGRFLQPAYPEQYRVEVNEQVARSLNIPLPDRDWLTDTVETMIQQSQKEAH